MPELTALELKIKSPAFVRGYLGRMLEQRSDSFYQSWLDEAIRLDANCKPGKTIQCGNVCRKPENCKKGAATARAKTQKQNAQVQSEKSFRPKKGGGPSHIMKAIEEGYTVEVESRDGERYKLSGRPAAQGRVAYTLQFTDKDGNPTKKTQQTYPPEVMKRMLSNHKLVAAQPKKARKTV